MIGRRLRQGTHVTRRTSESARSHRLPHLYHAHSAAARRAGCCSGVGGVGRYHHGVAGGSRAPSIALLVRLPAIATIASCEGADGAPTSASLWAGVGAVAVAGAAYWAAGLRGADSGSGTAPSPVAPMAREQLDRAASFRAEVYASRNKVLDRYSEALNAAAPEWVTRRADLPMQPSNGWVSGAQCRPTFSPPPGCRSFRAKRCDVCRG